MLPWPIAWYGMLRSGLHPALALSFIVPFMPCTLDPTGFFSSKKGLETLSEKSDGGGSDGDMSDGMSDAGSLAEMGHGPSAVAAEGHGHIGDSLDIRQKIPLFHFEHSVKYFVDFFVLVLFGLCNAGVDLTTIGPFTAVMYVMHPPLSALLMASAC
jgi:Na+/H+ antiporter NhaA